MRNYQRVDYGRTLLAYCDACYSILDAERQVYYQCLACSNYVVCMNCVPDIRNNHWPWHRFVARRGVPNEMMWVHMNVGITCNWCQQANFVGHRYQCIDCRDFDVCHRCSIVASRSHRLKLASNPQKAEMNRQLLAQRAVNALTDRTSPFYGQQTDFITGWSLAEARAALAEYQIPKKSKTMNNPNYSMRLRKKLEEMKFDDEEPQPRPKETEPPQLDDDSDNDDDDDESDDQWKDDETKTDDEKIDIEEYQRRHGLRRLGESPREEQVDEERLTGRRRH
jgi:hypothetical protein